VAVILELMPNRNHDHIGRGSDLHQRDVTRVPERDDQFAQEGVLARFSASERGGAQRLEAGADGGDGLLGQREVATLSRQFALQDEVEQAIEVVGGLAGQADAETHLRGVRGLPTPARAPSSLR